MRRQPETTEENLNEFLAPFGLRTAQVVVQPTEFSAIATTVGAKPSESWGRTKRILAYVADNNIKKGDSAPRLFVDSL